MRAFSENSSPKKQYRRPEFVIYGDIGQLTLKSGTEVDQNKGNPADMYWTAKTAGGAAPAGRGR